MDVQEICIGNIHINFAETKTRQVIMQIHPHVANPYLHLLGGSDQLHNVRQCPHTFNIGPNN